MSHDKQLHGTVVHQLPDDINLRQIQAHASLQSGLDKAWGETYLLVHAGELVLLTRGSVFDEYERKPLPPKHIPRLEQGTTVTELVIRTLDGDKRISVKRTEVKDLQKLIATLEEIYDA